jgi:CcmD family protein
VIRRRVPLLVLALALSSGGPAALRAQAAEPVSTAPAAAAGSMATSAPADAPQEPSGLPARETPPRTMRAYWHVFAAFAVAWLLLFGYALSLGRRFASLEREVRRMEGGRPA